MTVRGMALQAWARIKAGRPLTPRSFQQILERKGLWRGCTATTLDALEYLVSTGHAVANGESYSLSPFAPAYGPDLQVDTPPQERVTIIPSREAGRDSGDVLKEMREALKGKP